MCAVQQCKQSGVQFSSVPVSKACVLCSSASRVGCSSALCPLAKHVCCAAVQGALLKLPVNRAHTADSVLCRLTCTNGKAHVLLTTAVLFGCRGWHGRHWSAKVCRTYCRHDRRLCFRPEAPMPQIILSQGCNRPLHAPVQTARPAAAAGPRPRSCSEGRAILQSTQDQGFGGSDLGVQGRCTAGRPFWS